MADLVFYFFCGLIAQFVKAAVQAMRKSKPGSICAQCVFAHVQHTSKGRQAISCTYGGSVRPMTLDVLYCTEYRDRNCVVPIRLIGFEREISAQEPEMAKTDG